MIRFELAVFMLFFMPIFLTIVWKLLGFGKWGMILSWLGTVSNVIAVIANDWQMPVIGYHIEPGTLWKSGVGANLPWLCDRFTIPLGVCSIGDFFIFAGTAIATVWIIKRVVCTICC